MIDRQGRHILIECDSCDTVEKSEDGAEFDDFWSGLRREGWRAKRIAKEWLHGCPKCGPPT